MFSNFVLSFLFKALSYKHERTVTFYYTIYTVAENSAENSERNENGCKCFKFVLELRQIYNTEHNYR